MIVMNDEMKWNEDDRSCSAARRPGGLRTLGATQLGKMGEERGGYVPEVHVPDEEHVQICLNCTKKKCTGSCSKVGRTTTGRRRKMQNAKCKMQNEEGGSASQNCSSLQNET